MAGVPGAGIGGMFYLLTALAMPFIEAGRALRGRPDPDVPVPRWGLALGQAGIAVGVLVAIAAVGWFLAFMLPQAVAEMRSTGMEPGVAAAEGSSNVLRAGALLISFMSLTAVVGSVEVVRLWRHARKARGEGDPALEES